MCTARRRNVRDSTSPSSRLVSEPANAPTGRSQEDMIRQTPAIAGTPAVAEDEGVVDRAIVELDIFSGMPDPVWFLTEEDTRELERRFARLQTTDRREFSTDLGYRGFVVRLTAEDGEARLVRVQRGRVEVRAGATVEHYADPGRHLERELLRSGASVVAPEVLAVVEQDLSA